MRIAHLSDTHLGYRAFSRTVRGINLREWDVLRTFQMVLADIVRWRPDLVVHSGDLFDRPYPSRFTVVSAVKLLKQFAQLQVPIVIVSGNHDSSRSLQDSHIFSLLREALPSNIHLVYGQPARLTVETSAGLVELFAVPSESLLSLSESERFVPETDARYRVLVLHGVAPQLPSVFHSSTWFISGERFSPSDWSYIAWGDYHDRCRLLPNAWYAGATDYTSSNVWDERQPKGWLKVRLTTRQCRVEPVPSDPRPHLVVHVHNELPELPSVEGAVVRVVLHDRKRADEYRRELAPLLESAAIVQWIRASRSERASVSSTSFSSSSVSIAERWRQFVQSHPLPADIDEEPVTFRDAVYQRGLQALDLTFTAEDGG